MCVIPGRVLVFCGGSARQLLGDGRFNLGSILRRDLVAKVIEPVVDLIPNVTSQARKFGGTFGKSDQIGYMLFLGLPSTRVFLTRIAEQRTSPLLAFRQLYFDFLRCSQRTYIITPWHINYLPLLIVQPNTGDRNQ